MPRNYVKRRSRYTPRENNGFWLTFSDLMSALLLVFVLVMFYSVYQYFDMLELKTAELMRQSGLLDAKEVELTAKDQELTLKDQELVLSQTKLTESEQVLVQQQYQLLLTKQAQEAAEKSLGEQQKDLDDALALLQMKEEDLATAKALVANQQFELSTQREQLDSASEQLISQQARMGEQQARLDALVGVKAQIVTSLADALSRASIKAKVDGTTGSIALDANVLFDVGKSELKPEGMAALDQFVPVYLSVLMDESYLNNISEIIIEGHTDSTGSYLENLKLSQERALAVMSYLLSDLNTRMSEEMKQTLRKIGTCNGRSFANLVTGMMGMEDQNASRRVEFKFRMQDEQMIESMRDILGSMDPSEVVEVVPAAP